MSKIKNAVIIYDINKNLQVNIKSLVPFSNNTSAEKYNEELKNINLNGLVLNLA